MVRTKDWDPSPLVAKSTISELMESMDLALQILQIHLLVTLTNSASWIAYLPEILLLEAYSVMDPYRKDGE